MKTTFLKNGNVILDDKELSSDDIAQLLRQIRMFKPDLWWRVDSDAWITRDLNRRNRLV